VPFVATAAASHHHRMQVVVVGAGLSGLVAARRLTHAGCDVTVLDKGAVPGGRLATRRLDGATLDTGAQFFTIRSDAFAALAAEWLAAGVVYEWNRGFGDPADGHPRYAAHGGMAALAAHLAAGLDVRTTTMVFAVRAGPGRWDVALDDGAALSADALVLTCPVPQSASLLITADAEIPAELRRLEYDRTIALLVALDGPSAVPPPGGHQAGEGTFSFVADNHRKGVSTVPALTLHAHPAVSAEHWDDDANALEAWLLDAARPWFGSSAAVATRVERWRFATPRHVWPDPCWVAAAGPAPVVMAGDAFAGPKVEGAALSGLAAAAALV
jgi:renalase